MPDGPLVLSLHSPARSPLHFFEHRVCQHPYRVLQKPGTLADRLAPSCLTIRNLSNRDTNRVAANSALSCLVAPPHYPLPPLPLPSPTPPTTHNQTTPLSPKSPSSDASGNGQPSASFSTPLQPSLPCPTFLLPYVSPYPSLPNRVPPRDLSLSRRVIPVAQRALTLL